VRSINQGGADFIKVSDGVPRESYFAIIDEARKLGLPVAGHIPTEISSFEASDAGQKSFEHLGNILRSCSKLSPSEIDERAAARLTPGTRPNDASLIPARIAAHTQIELESYSNAKCYQLFARFVRNRTWQVPTLIAKQSSAFVDSIMQVDDARGKYISRATHESWRPENNFFLKYRTPQFIEMRKKLYQKEIELVRRMHKAGVGFMAGTDIPAPYMYPGFSLHDELGLLVTAGFTPFEALLTATRKPAEYLNLSRELGTIQKGKLADLILLDANPVTNISNTKQIRAVIFDGRYFSKEMLEKMLDDVKTAAQQR
jgi:imidazolonepropionase-like amidohydrolase